MISSNDLRPGVTIQHNNGVWAVVDAMHVKPGKGSAFVRTKLKNVETGSVLEVTFRAGEKMPSAMIEKEDMQYLFKSGENFTMMNTATFEQIELEEKSIGDVCEFLKEGLEGITVLRWDGKIIGVELPNSVELEITECAPDERGDTSSGGGKPATLETGAVITVPFHIKVGDRVKVDTRTRKYVTRV
ncbi:elongation factor P [Candidatus Obscuribacterales bacterium]|nr:elongation factor P [Candidatus Obscuribacterales bacterium]